MTDRHDVDALEAELAKIIDRGWEWGQGPGTAHFRQVEVDLIEARREAQLPMLNVTYGGIGYRLSRVPAGSGFWKVEHTGWEPEEIGGAFGVVQRLGDGRRVIGAILDNGEGERWLAADVDAITVATD